MKAFEELNDNYDPNSKLKSIEKLLDPDKNKVIIKGVDLRDIREEVFCEKGRLGHVILSNSDHFIFRNHKIFDLDVI